MERRVRIGWGAAGDVTWRSARGYPDKHTIKCAAQSAGILTNPKQGGVAGLGSVGGSGGVEAWAKGQKSHPR